VKAALGFQSIKGRILSLFHPDREVVKTVEQWWAGATPVERLRVLSNERHMNVIGGRADLLPKVQDWMPQIGCPFLGALAPKKGTPKASGSAAPVEDGGEA
jgi:hypothetical protein